MCRLPALPAGKPSCWWTRLDRAISYPVFSTALCTFSKQHRSPWKRAFSFLSFFFSSCKCSCIGSWGLIGVSTVGSEFCARHLAAIAVLTSLRYCGERAKSGNCYFTGQESAYVHAVNTRWALRGQKQVFTPCYVIYLISSLNPLLMPVHLHINPMLKFYLQKAYIVYALAGSWNVHN